MSFVEKNIEMWNTRMLFEGFCTEGELGFFFFFKREMTPIFLCRHEYSHLVGHKMIWKEKYRE